jgi:para-aminobenzoate synthetase/4-amino-4-deoxychorismate lyase
MNTAQYGVGGGITWDSTSEDEYNEILAKAALLNEERTEFDLLETMLLENGNYNCLERHLKRLRGSAEYFGYSFSDTEIRERLKEHAQAHPSEARRVRLLLAENGKVCIESTPCTPDLNQSIKVVSIANQPINRNNRFLYHKTTHRRLYDEFKKARPQVFDVLLWNEDNELTEFTIGNIVLEIDGIKSTPPVSCGLLPGVFREELLARGEIVQRVLTRKDLSRATRVWLINSLRGWVPVYVE